MFRFKPNIFFQYTTKHPGYINAFSLIAIACTNVIFQFLNFSLMSKYLSVKDFGSYRTFLSIISFSGLFHAGYIDGLVTRWVVDKQSPELKVFLVAGVFTILLSWPLIFYPFPAASFIFILAFLLINNFLSLAGGMFIKFRVFVIQPLYLLVSQVFLFTLMMLKQSSLTVYQLIYYTAIFSGIIVFALVIYLKRMVKFSISIRNIRKQLVEVFDDVKAGFAILLIGLFFIAIIHIDKVILPLYVPAEQFGYYSFASSIITVLIGVIAAPINLVFSKLANHDKDSAAKLYHKIYISILVCSLLVMLSYPLLQLVISRYLPKYIPSYHYLRGYIGMFFPVLILQLLTTNIYRQKKRMRFFLNRSFFVLLLIGIFYLVSYLFKIDIQYYPLVLAQLLLLFVMYNERQLASAFTELRGKYAWVRLSGAVIVNVGMLLLFFVVK